VSQTPQVWLNSFVFEEAGGLVVELDAVKGLFPAGLVADLAGACQALLLHLGGAAAWDEAAFDLLPAHTRAARAAANATEVPLPTELLHDGFLQRAAEAPEAIALITPAGTITYGELARRASGIADWLGDQQGRLVGVVMEKGWEQVAAALGILMAGGAYLPVAADLPEARIAAILRSGEATHVLATPDTAARVPDAVAHDRVLAVTAKLAGAVPEPAGSRDPAEQEALAYVLFTSGSTGTPKGVMVTHRSAVNLVADINARFVIGPEDRLFGISAFNFDLSVWDIFGALGAGAALVLPAEADRLSPEAWAAQAAAAGVTVWNSVPAIVGMALESGLPQTLRLVMMSGDKVPVDLAHALLARPGLTVMSLGGPTETTVWNVMHAVAGLSADAPRVPYGRPNGNNRLHVLDAQGRPCPDWVAGELHAAGAGVARGYWKDEARTEAAFFRSEIVGDRLYATGDVCFWRPDGVLDILGRTDFQVKINGLRVELGEIETRLTAHPDIERAVAFAAGGVAGQRLACAYVATPDARAGAHPETAELARYLAEVLPDYMVPQVFLPLDALPLTANGKVDRKALTLRVADGEPADGATPNEPERAPSGDIETALAAIWAEVLNTATPPANVPFPVLGGTSLSAVRIVAEISRRIGQRLTVKEFTQLATIETVARRLQARRAPGTAAE
jgi:amino acid adenylation domain-containing protein